MAPEHPHATDIGRALNPHGLVLGGVAARGALVRHGLELTCPVPAYPVAPRQDLLNPRGAIWEPVLDTRVRALTDRPNDLAGLGRVGAAMRPPGLALGGRGMAQHGRPNDTAHHWTPDMT